MKWAFAEGFSALGQNCTILQFLILGLQVELLQTADSDEISESSINMVIVSGECHNQWPTFRSNLIKLKIHLIRKKLDLKLISSYPSNPTPKIRQAQLA